MKLLVLLMLFGTEERELDLTSSWVTDADLTRVGRMTSLERLDLGQTKVTDAGLQQLKGLANLRELSLYYAEYISEDGLAVLKNYPKLERLNLRGARVTSKVFEHVAALKNLRELDVSFTEIIDDGFDQLTSLEKLEKLSIGGNRLTGECLAFLKQMPALRDLDVGGTQRVDSGLWGLPLTDANLRRLGELKQLRRLSLRAATISDRGVDKPGHPEAERMELADLSALGSLTGLAYLDVTRQPITEAALKAIEGLPAWKELRYGPSKNLTGEASRQAIRRVR